MPNYLCEKCKYSEFNALTVSLRCPKCGNLMIENESIIILSPKGIETGRNACIISKGGQIKVSGYFQNKGVTMGTNSKIDVGSDFINRGKVDVHDTDISVGGILYNEGSFLVNDPQKIKDILLEIANTAKNVTEIGVMVTERIFGKR